MLGGGGGRGGDTVQNSRGVEVMKFRIWGGLSGIFVNREGGGEMKK